MITCGRCTKAAKDEAYGVLVEVGSAVRHDTTDDVRACYAAPAGRLEAALLDWYEAEARAELEAEARNERFWEERGADDYTGSEEEARDRFYDSLR